MIEDLLKEKQETSRQMQTKGQYEHHLSDVTNNHDRFRPNDLLDDICSIIGL